MTIDLQISFRSFPQQLLIIPITTFTNQKLKNSIQFSFCRSHRLPCRVFFFSPLLFRFFFHCVVLFGFLVNFHAPSRTTASRAVPTVKDARYLIIGYVRLMEFIAFGSYYIWMTFYTFNKIIFIVDLFRLNV